MRFKSIEMTGFKAFSDRTKVLFQPGITAIVGPNGCGKSNISDAVRWVLGEQSAKQVRGEKMEDVIFNGTPSRPPMGMAEVTLVVTDLDAGVASDFAAFDEIQITRRYYRSGESEYLINRIPCRLMDIRELFMDTGMGAKAYTILGQGNISAILNAKPVERRFLFEEAAGISKYKARKEEALRKLTRTRDNLSRVRDIIAEVTRQRNSLNRQAKKAERYKTYKDEVREIDLHLSALEFAALRHEWEGLEQEYQRAKERETELLSLTSATETRIEELELEVLDREKALAGLQEEKHRIEARIAGQENRVAILDSEIAHLESLTQASNREIARLQKEIVETRNATERLQGEHDAVCTEVTRKEQDLADNEARLSALRETQRKDEQALEQAKQKLAEMMRQIGIQKNRMENMAMEKDSLLEEHSGYDTSRSELGALLSRAKEDLAKKERSLTNLQEAIGRMRSEQEAVQADLDHKQAALASVQERLSQLREQIGQESSRLETLTELQQNLDGYDEGIRSLVQRAKEGSSDPLPELQALVADIFETDPQYEAAIEAAISNLYQSLVLNSPEDSLRAVEFLRRNRMGRGSFIPLAPRLSDRTPFAPREGAGVVGEALNLVRFDPRYTAVAEYLLGNVVVVEDLKGAVALYRSNGFRRTLVTLEGEVLDPAGKVEGGARRKNTSGFIRRKREIRELRISLGVLKQTLSAAEEERSGLTEEIQAIKERLRGSTARLEALDTERSGLEKEIAGLEGEAAHLGREMEGLAHQNEHRTTEMHALEESLAACRHEVQHLEQGQSETRGVIRALTEKSLALRQEIESQQKTITDGRVEIAAIREKGTSLSSHIRKNRETLKNLEELSRAREREIAAAAEDTGRIREEKRSTEAAIQSLIAGKEELRHRITGEQDAFETQRIKLQEEQKAFKEMRHETEKVNHRVNDLEVRRTELSIKSDHLATRVREKYQVGVRDMLPVYQDREIDRESAVQRLEELNRKIDQMGPVNITAIEEYQALQERFDFLTTQEADLQESVEGLMEAIRKINRTSRQRFREAFQAINENFQKVFQELFQGGHAELRLEEGEDILEAGVEVIVQPPGKKLQHLSLLSGGESALTAVALIFAGFLVKPSPFCLLDEVDAPLDDANVERYNEMLKRLTRDTQFIIITHNKRTMGYADALYGITMQEPGISKMVSVRFNDGHEARISA